MRYFEDILKKGYKEIIFDVAKNDLLFFAQDFPKLRKYFKENAYIERCLYYVLIENMYNTISRDNVQRKLVFTTFEYNQAKEYIVSLPIQTDVVFGVKGYLKKNLLIFKNDQFIFSEFSLLENEDYLPVDLINLIEEQLII